MRDCLINVNLFDLIVAYLVNENVYLMDKHENI